MAEKVTVMVLKVDLQCPCCYKKVKKILCKFPQIRDQIYNEKANTVTIKVVCCNPEKLRDKLCCKGCKVIKSIEIVDPPKPPKETPPPPEKPVEKPPKEKPPPPEKPVEKPPKETPPPPEPDPKPRTCCGSCYEGRGGGPCYQGYPPARTCCGSCYEGQGGGPCYQGYPSTRTCCGSCYEGRGGGPCYQGYPPARTCCESCYEGRGGGPCYQGYHRYGVPPQPQPSFDGYVGYGYGRGGYGVSRCDSYLSEENPHSCAIM